MSNRKDSLGVELPAGARIGNDYEVVSLLGVGGQARVYKVQSLRYQREFAAKVFCGRHKKEYYREADALRQLSHPNVISCYDLMIDEGFPIAVIEYCAGGSLQDEINENHDQGLPLDRALKLTKQILSAVSYIHYQGLAHRDIKPGNCLFKDEARNHIALSDFGMATATQGASERPVGTLCYMAPELFTHANLNLQAADCWSVGILIHVVVHGVLPYRLVCGDQDLLLRDIISGQTLVIEDGHPLDPLIIGLLHQDPVKRWQMAHTYAIFEAIERRIKGVAKAQSELTPIRLSPELRGRGARIPRSISLRPQPLPLLAVCPPMGEIEQPEVPPEPH